MAFSPLQTAHEGNDESSGIVRLAHAHALAQNLLKILRKHILHDATRLVREFVHLAELIHTARHGLLPRVLLDDSAATFAFSAQSPRRLTLRGAIVVGPRNESMLPLALPNRSRALRKKICQRIVLVEDRGRARFGCAVA